MRKGLALADSINKRKWWHSQPADNDAYKKRGLFLASSYKECEFYGRPIDEPIKVNVSHPLVNTEKNIIRFLFGDNSSQISAYIALINGTAKEPLKLRFKLDRDLLKAAKNKKHDAIAVVTVKGLKKLKIATCPAV